jgi:enoyl-CoA hydratase/carnithine racemase
MAPPLGSLHLDAPPLDASGGAVARLSLDHGKINEMGSAQLDDFEALCAWLETGAVRALVVSSRKVTEKGTRIFIAGANVTERVGWADERVKAHVRRQRAVLGRLRAAPVFTVAVVDGVALGWGTEFLLCCDYRIGAPGARLGLPETGLGILPGAGGTSELAARIGLNQALRLGMTGETVELEEAVRIGLLDEAAGDREAALARAEALASRAATRSPTAMAAFKAGALAAQGLDPEARVEVEARAYEHCVDSGEAALGRASFQSITAGQGAPWGPFRGWRP